MESTGSNNWNNFYEDNSFDIDKEWEEFNIDLSKESETALEGIRARAEYDEISRHVIDKLRNLNLPGRVIDSNPDIEEELFREYALMYVEGSAPKFLDEDGEIEKYHEVRIAVNCIMEYYKERELQALIVNEIALCKYFLQKSNGHMLMNTLVAHEKKRLQAELIVHHDMNELNPWYVYLSQEVNTESLDQYSEQDQSYLLRAQESLEDHKNYYIKRKRVIEKAKAIIGMNELEEDLSRVIQVTADIIELHLIASEPAINDREKMNRNEQLWEYGRNNGFSSKNMREIITLLECEN